MNILKLKPIFKDYIWGGTRLKDDFDFQSDLDRIAEAWVVACHPDGECTVDGGKYSEMKLSEVVNKHPEYLGTNCTSLPYFPILVKLIDAKDKLSVQVHPSDEYALKYENSFGKTEMWYILDAAPNSYLYFGFKKDITKEEFLKRIQDNTLTDVLNAEAVHAGDVFFIEPGTVHAIGAGILVAEIQQNSNITYRIYDYDRRDRQNNPRPLHIDKAIAVSDLTATKPGSVLPSGVLADCKYFTVIKKEIFDTDEITIDTFSFRILLCIKGKLDIENIHLKAGESVLISAENATVSLSGNATILEIFIK